MKKKLIALLLALALAVGIMPAGALAVVNTIDSTMPYSAENRPAVKNVENDLELEKQLMLEDLDEEYYALTLPEQYYCKAVWKELSSVHQKERERIQNATNVKTLNRSSDKIQLAANRIYVLASLNLQKVRRKGDLKRLQQALKEDFQLMKKKYKKSAYNDYYWNIFEDREAETSAMLNQVLTKGTFTAYADAFNAVDVFQASEDDDEDDLFLILLDPLNDTGIRESSALDFLGNWLYTKKELKDIRSRLVKEAKRYVKQDLRQKGFTGKSNQFDSIISKFEKEIKQVPDAESLAQKYTDLLITIEKKAKINRQVTPPSNSDRIRMEERMKEVFYQNYQMKDYSFSGWNKLEDIYSLAIQTVEELTDATKLKDSMITAMQQKMNKVPTLRKELTNAQNKAITRLKKYLKNRKYDRRKVKTVVQKGTAEIRNCKDPDDVEGIYWKYEEKAEDTVRRFKIRTKKKGKGTITKTQTVDFGDSCTIELMPNAGHRIKKVLIDGKKKKLKNSYSFDNVRRSYIIVVQFK